MSNLMLPLHSSWGQHPPVYLGITQVLWGIDLIWGEQKCKGIVDIAASV